MGRHTPGEWLAKRALRPAAGGYDYAIAAVIEGKPRVIGEAYAAWDQGEELPAADNAALMASAPRLLEQLEETQRVLTKLMVLLHEKGLTGHLDDVQVLFDSNQRLLGPLR